MQERHVTVGRTRHLLPDPFFVLATQNPIEQEGTYPLPEAQLDRFMFNIVVSYPSRNEELQIMKQTTSNYKPELQPILDGKQILRLQDVVRQIVVADHVFAYAVDLIRFVRQECGGEEHDQQQYAARGVARSNKAPVPIPTDIGGASSHARNRSREIRRPR